MLIYILILLILIIIEVVYFKLADRFNIIDKPNERSSHITITLRGGGVIFYVGAMIYFFSSGFQYPWFFLGLTLMSIISFLDDILTLSNKIRLFVHFISVLLLCMELDVFQMPWYYLAITFIITVGVINAYNFMDGINGITSMYSLAIGTLLLIVNENISFVEKDYLIYPMLGVLVFTFFNFRHQAKCFAGDVGAIAICFILLFALGLLIIQTQNFIYILFLAIYGVDAIWTIIRRLYLKENIFQAHRSHLYQYLVNEMGLNKLIVAFCYGLLQFLVGLFVIWLTNFNIAVQSIASVSLLLILSLFYLYFKQRIIKRYVIL